jgi:hypothetical protein
VLNCARRRQCDINSRTRSKSLTNYKASDSYLACIYRESDRSVYRYHL